MYCQNRLCHYNNTTDRIRAKKSPKPYYVNRTAKTYFHMFCSQGCYTDFMYAYCEEQIALPPRTEALETPIEDPKKTRHETAYGYGWNQWDIKVDESRQS